MAEDKTDIKVEKESKKQEKPVETAKPAEEKSETKKPEQAKEETPAKPEKKTKKKEKQIKVELEREYIVPLRKSLLKTPRYKRAKKAIKTIKEFLAKHMKVEDRDIGKVKIDMFLNQEIWFRGIKNPPSKIKVIAKKMSDGIVNVELADIPDKVKFDMARKEKIDKAGEKTKSKSKPSKEGLEQTVETEEQAKDAEEKEKASVEAGLEKQKEQAKTAKHTAKAQTGKAAKQQVHRKAMKR